MNLETPIVIALGGYSEAGKSSSGRLMEKLGYERIKIADIYRRLYEAADTKLNFVEWSNWIDKTDPIWIGEAFVLNLIEDLNKVGASKCTIESLYGDVLATELKKHLGDRFKIIFVDIDRETRLQRQMHRESLKTIEEAEKLMDPRDDMKRSWGADKVKNIADFLVDNSGHHHPFANRNHDRALLLLRRQSGRFAAASRQAAEYTIKHTHS